MTNPKLPESHLARSEAWRRKHARRAYERLASVGVWSAPNVTSDGEFTGRIVVDPDQLFDLLNDLDLRALEA